MVVEMRHHAARMNAKLLDFIERQHSELFAAWREALCMCWSEADSSKLEQIVLSREEGSDLVSVTLNVLAGDDKAFSKGVDVLTAKVQHREYSISDLYTEVACFEEVLEPALAHSGVEEPNHVDAVRWARRELRRLFGAVLGETALIHETVIERGRRGYCRVDDTGLISLANAQLAELLGVEVAEGVNLLDHISGDAERNYVLAAIRGNYGSQPGIRRLRLTKSDGARIIVNAEIGPLCINGWPHGGYAVLTDISAILNSEEKIFNESPLGIVRLDDRRRLIYANRMAREILGIGNGAIENWTIWDLVPSEGPRRLLEEQIKLRDQGLSNEYLIEITRLNDRESVPITVASMPEVDSSGHTVGTLSIIRSRVAEEIDRCIGACRSAKDLLEGVAKITRKFISCRSFTVSIFSYDDTNGLIHVNPIFIHADQASQLRMRWFPISQKFVDWLGRLDSLGRPVPLLIPDWRDFLQEPEAEGLSDIPDVQRGLKEGQVNSFVVCAIPLGGRIGATVSLSSQHLNAFTKEDWERLVALPLDRAVQMALYYRDQEEQKFRHHLLREITCCPDSLSVVEILTKALAKHYQWQNVSAFMVNEIRHVFELKAQMEGPNDGYTLPEFYTQPLSEGLLGEALRTGKPLKVNDVENDQRYAKIYKPANPQTRSELCLPIKIKDQIRWILNIDDKHVNAFSNDEQLILQNVCNDIEFFLGHLFDLYLFDEIVHGASDFIIITDHASKIVQLNPAAEYALGIETHEAKGRSIGSLLPDADRARFLVESRKIAPEETELVAKDGNRLTVLLSGRLLPEALGRKVFFARDLTPIRRCEELETISRVLYEIAAQARTPLSLVSGWLGRIKGDLAKHSGSIDNIRQIADVIDKAMRQLKKVELPYERVVLLYGEVGTLPYNKRRLNIVRLVDETLAELPKAEQSRIEKEIAAPLPHLHGDSYRLAFIVRTILSYLLRFLPEDERIGVHLSCVDSTLHISIKGLIPENAAEGELKDPAASLLADISLGKHIIERFVQQHGGTYEPPSAGGKVEFRITLPAS